MEKIISTNSMNTHALNNLTKSQLINLLLKQNAEIKLLLLQNMKQQPTNKDNIIQPPSEFKDDHKPVPAPRTKKPIPAPRKTVKQMVQEYEDNIIQPPLEFRDDYKPTPKPRTKKPTPLPRTKIDPVAKALKGFTKSFEIGIKNNKDPLAQLQNTRKAIEYHIMRILKSMKGLKFVETLKVTFKKLAKDKIIHKIAYFNSKPKSITQKSQKCCN